ncbi:universal stress protein [Actinoplanes sp. LDG1-06]|uniref:Universal stress protein n=1 Tax=Paractinoplanes ovalisporus TaxID=2810368 RepID=A0ABS2A923_9ACTN|nr:universal stress protein [Actinoplanes ovalisporus]MBM2616342.1 universal stress protein [Actinoplanes ovalisporus]
MTQPFVPRVMLAYDGSPASGATFEVAAALLPRAHATVVHLWTPPFASETLRRRLWHGTRRVDDFVVAIEREGAAEAARLAAMGVTLARAVGWPAEPMVERAYGGEGLQLAELAEKLGPDVVVLGSRGLTGARAVLGSVSDMAVHYLPQPALVIPCPLLTAERVALATGPVLVGWDGSPGARAAAQAAERIFAGRRIALVAVRDGSPAPAAPPGRPRIVADVPAGHAATSRAVAEALATTAAEQHAAVVVVGSRGRSALREIVLGSVAMATLHQSVRPVLVVPDAAAEHSAARDGASDH